ncbi:MAG: hypothetical protein OHK0029_17470 [Armatimonadaceae bacterium]
MVNELTSDKDEQKALKDALREVFKAYEEEARRLSIENDVAGAMAFYLLTNYQIYTGTPDVSDDATRALVNQMRSVLGEPLKDTSNAEKQKMYEAFLVTSALLLLRHQVAEAEKSEADIKASKESAGGNLRDLLKVEPGKIKIGDKGLEIAGAATGSTEKPVVAQSDSVPTLSFSTDGWTVVQNQPGSFAVLTRKTAKGTLTAMIYQGPTAMESNREELFWKVWKMGVENTFKVDSPIDHLCRRRVGNTQAYFYYAKALADRNYGTDPTALYLLEAGDAFFWMLIRFSPEDTTLLSTSLEAIGNTTQDDANLAVEGLLASIKIQGKFQNKPLYAKEEIAGKWDMLTAGSLGSYYSTTSGSYVGDASSGASDALTLRPDGTFHKFTTVLLNGKLGGSYTVEGKYRIEGDLLVMTYTKKPPTIQEPSETHRIVAAGLDRNGKKQLVLTHVQHPLSYQGIKECRPFRPAGD